LSILLAVSGTALAADTNGLPDPSSSLRPPRGEILPSFWEQYAAWVIFASVFLVMAIAFAIWLLARPKPAVPIHWSIQARQELEPLRPLPEDGILLSRVSHILRHHLAAACGLSLDETTTSEFCQALLASERIGPDLAREIAGFLKKCDLLKFAPTPPQSPFGAVDRSLEIIGSAEARLKQVKGTDSLSGTPDPSRSSNEERQPTAARGV